mmetsp:Transcript_38908/g.61626  ORF Transcript_38908/g.61626 Transcript_38908/m.61626 type:complete len:121 (-) Transcript_38908:14-376(-)
METFFFLIYGINNKTSFEKTETIHDLLRYFKLNSVLNAEKKKVTVMLVGNKTDLFNEREVTTNEGRERAELEGMVFREICAKTGEGVGSDDDNNIFYHLIRYAKDPSYQQEPAIHIKRAR